MPIEHGISNRLDKFIVYLIKFVYFAIIANTKEIVYTSIYKLYLIMLIFVSTNSDFSSYSNLRNYCGHGLHKSTITSWYVLK